MEMAGETILIVDDDMRNVEFLRDSLLLPSGYTTLCATDGAEAVRLALTDHPDLILLDLQMPKMDGFQVLETLKKEGVEIPAILITAHGSENIAAHAFRLGVRDYFPKPFKVAEIMEAVDKSLTEARLRKEKKLLSERVEMVNRQLEQRLKELSILYGISKAVASVLDLDTLLIRVVEAARYVIGAAQTSLFLLDDETDKLILGAVQTSDDPRARVPRQSTDDSLVRQVVTTGRATILRVPRSQGRGQSWLVLAVPLKVRDKAIGALCASRADGSVPFSDHDRYLLSALGDFAAVSIDNARLHESTQRELAERIHAEEAVRRLAYHDTLTGLPNRTLFNDRLGVALAHARRNKQRVAVMLLDLDHFKGVNDTLGHSVGDQLLKAVGDRLVSVLRESDTVCRMGGDEFLLLLPEMAEPGHASNVAERVLEVIRQPFILGRHVLRVTTSAGYAIYPDDGEEGDDLVKKADSAMYRAKDKGRDNYQHYTEETD
jgi:diguanylate cyclase (GGDEF)-like protein